MSHSPSISIVVPLYNEEANVEPLAREIRQALGTNHDWELLLVDDGSDDATAERAAHVAAGDERIGLIQLARNYGKTTALQAGFDHSGGAVVVTLDGDLQNDPNDIPRVLAKLDEGFDLVVGYRKNRTHRLWTRKLPSWLANRLIDLVTGIPIRDNGCGLKAFKSGVVSDLHLYSELHRFIPSIAASTTHARIDEIAVRDHPRQAGQSKYGLSRTWRVLSDLLTISMIRWFRDRPLSMFAWVAFAAFLAGVFFLGASLVSYAYFVPEKAVAVVFPGVATLSMSLGVFLLLLGLIAEVVVETHSANVHRSS